MRSRPPSPCSTRTASSISHLAPSSPPSWEHRLHDEERAALLGVLFDAATRGITVSVLSGDVHVSAAFAIHDGEGHRIWQLTSSAITYNIPRPLSWVLRHGAADEGETEDGTGSSVSRSTPTARTP